MIIDCISEIQQLKMDDESFLLVRVGTDQRPASIADIDDMKKWIAELNLPNLKYLVTHHFVDFQVCNYQKDLEAKTTETDVIISKDSFEHLLNCLDNQKFIREVNADAVGSMSAEEIHGVQDNAQAVIDDFNRQCRNILRDYRSPPGVITAPII